MMLHRNPTNTEQLVEKNILHWELMQMHDRTSAHQPTIAISRQAGSYGLVVANQLARDLKMDLYDEQIVHEIATRSRVSERIIRTLDEKARTQLEDLLVSLERHNKIGSDEYFKYLVRVIAVMEAHGNGIILGRGSTFILRHHRLSGNLLAVRFIAPQDFRIDNIMNTKGWTWEEAKRYVQTTDADRAKFAQRYFQTDINDNQYFDLVINNQYVDIDQSVELIRMALQLMNAKTHYNQLHGAEMSLQQ